MSSHDRSHPAYSHPVTDSTADTFIFQNFPPRFVPGVSSPLAWSLNLNGTISLKLLQGPINNALTISTIAHFIENKGSFFWTPSISIAPGENYFLQIISDDDEELFVFSPRFSITDYIVRRKELDASFASSAIPTTSRAVTTTTTAPLVTSRSTTSTTQLTTSTSSSLRTSTSIGSIQTTSTGTGIATHQTSTQTTETLQSLTFTSSTRAGTSAATSAAGDGGGGLSTGAAVGIGVGATLAGLVIIAAIVFFIFRLKKRRRQPPPHDPSQPAVPELGVENPLTPPVPSYQPYPPHPSVSELGIAKPPGPKLEAEKFPEKETRPYPYTQSPPIAEMAQPLSPAEYSELDSRRRAAELEGRFALPTGLQSNPRAELEARRVAARQIYEIGPTS